MKSRITIDFSEEARARKVVSRSNHRVTGKYPGLKSGKMHHWESHLEQDAFCILDIDPEVISFREQPAKLTYRDTTGARRIHYPDILVRLPSRKEFVEVKPDKEAESSEVLERTRCIQPLLAERGFGYRVWKESEIRHNGALISNIRFLLRYGRTPVPLVRFEQFRRRFGNLTSLTWDDVTNTTDNPSALNDAARLVIDGVLRIALDCPITDDTPVVANF